jgi:hypothetical protein
MSDLDREHLLQKVVAVSGFVFALLILPVAQYLLVHGGQPEQGAVAGVSTEESVINSNVPALDPVACQADKEAQLAELQEWNDGRMAALDRDFAAAVKPYQDAITLVTGENVAAEQEALGRLIADETTNYETKKNQILAAVDKRVKEISSTDCQ